jgi:hypothetical protein
LGSNAAPKNTDQGDRTPPGSRMNDLIELLSPGTAAMSAWQRSAGLGKNPGIAATDSKRLRRNNGSIRDSSTVRRQRPNGRVNV